MNKVIYQLTTEDVSHFLTNKEHLNEVIRRIQRLGLSTKLWKLNS